MRHLTAVMLLAACGSSTAPAPEIASDEHPPFAPITAGKIAAGLRIAELHADGTALIDGDGPPLTIGARYQVAALELFGGEAGAHPVVTVTIDEKIAEFLDYDDTQQFLVCSDSRGGDPPPLYRAHVTGGSLDGLAATAAAVAWPVELELDYAAATGDSGPRESDEPDARAEGEAIQLDDDPGLEQISSVIRFLDANADCPFPYETWEIAFDDDGKRVATRPSEAACFSQIPMFHDMACCSEPVCAPHDRRPLCAWPPSFKPQFEPDLAPARFTDRPFIANLSGPIAGALRQGKAAVWIRHSQSFEGEAFGIYHADASGAIVADADVYIYHCAY